MKRYTIKIALSFLFAIILINNSTYFFFFSQAQDITDNDNYYTSFDLSGDITIVGTGRFIISGSFRIDALFDKTTNVSEYIIQYSASIPTQTLDGRTKIKENSTDKKLIYDEIDQSLIGIIWNSYSDNSQNDIYSIFHLIRSEINSNFFRLLNFTTNKVKTFNLLSPGLAKSVKTYQISLVLPSTQLIELFFDITYLRLMGISARVALNLDGTDYFVNINALVSQVNFPLVKADLEQIFIIINSLISISILIVIILVIRSKYSSSNKIAIKGGLSNDGSN